MKTDDFNVNFVSVTYPRKWWFLKGTSSHQEHLIKGSRLVQLMAGRCRAIRWTNADLSLSIHCQNCIRIGCRMNTICSNGIWLVISRTAQLVEKGLPISNLTPHILHTREIPVKINPANSQMGVLPLVYLCFSKTQEFFWNSSKTQTCLPCETHIAFLVIEWNGVWL